MGWGTSLHPECPRDGALDCERHLRTAAAVGTWASVASSGLTPHQASGKLGFLRALRRAG